MEDEEWRPVRGYKDYYEVSNIGRVRRIKAGCATHVGRIKTLAKQRHGYLKVGLSRNCKMRWEYVHKLVLEAFSSPRPTGGCYRHLNGVKDDNILANLRWGTPKENYMDSVSHGTAAVGEKNAGAKLTNAAVLAIRASTGKTQDELAREFGVCQAVISTIILRTSWTHV